MAAQPPSQTPASPPGEVDGHPSLALAVVYSSAIPMLLLDGELNVLAVSASFARDFHVDPSEAMGRPVFELGEGEWDVPQLRSLLGATASGGAEVESYELTLNTPGRAVRLLVLTVRKLDYDHNDQVRVLMAAADVTEARASERHKDELLREKAILLQESHHRVANSLQIIASVLLQSARKVESEESRSYLRDAHNRVMSFAELQRQLTASKAGAIALRPYFTQLCKSIAASMIQDPGQLALDVEIDDVEVDAEVSVSLGLIATELVINALKHAFPQGRRGRIMVSFVTHGPNWTLSVRDNGVGMPKAPREAQPGLGSSIVEAVARQLDARIELADTLPGTAVSIIHAQLAAVADDREAARAV